MTVLGVAEVVGRAEAAEEAAFVATENCCTHLLRLLCDRDAAYQRESES